MALGYIILYCHGSRHEPEYNALNGVVIEEGYVRVTMRVWYKDIWIKKRLRMLGTGINRVAGERA